MFETIDGWLESVPTLFYPTVAAGLNEVFQVDLDGAPAFWIQVTPTAAAVTTTPRHDTTVVVATSAHHWLDIVNRNDAALISELVASKSLTLTPFDPELFKWFALALRADRSRSEEDFKKILVGSIEVWEIWQSLWLPVLQEHGLKPSHRLLDLGCGTLRVGSSLIRYLERGHYVGVDIRPEVLVEGRRELERLGLTDKQPELVHCPDVGQLDLGRRFDVVLAGSVLVHLEDDIFDGFLATVAKHLAPSGSFFANVNVREFLENPYEGLRWLGFPFVARSFEFYRDKGRAHGLEISDLGAPKSDHPMNRQQRIIRYKLAGE